MNPGIPTRWTPENIARAIQILSRHAVLDTALLEMTAEFGFEVTRPGAYSAFIRAGYQSPFTYLIRRIPRAPESRHDTTPEMAAVRVPSNDFTNSDTEVEVELAEERDPESPTSILHARYEALVALAKKHTKKGGIDLETLCDELDLIPREVRDLIDEAREHGVFIDIAHDRLHLKPPEPSPSTPPISVAPTAYAGSHHRIAIVSDMHFGSKYCLREQMACFIVDAYESGIRDFFCPGDLLEGCYRHAQWELSAASWEDQANEFLDTLPMLPDMRFFFIDGNHDWTWTEKNGTESGRSLVHLAQSRGRNDLYFFGSRGALIQYGDTKIELWHPKKGNGYALSYQLQNKIRDTAPERLPHILLTGHTHQYVKLRRSNVWAMYAGTWQHGDAPYGRSLGGDTSMGGILLEWTMEEDGTVRKLTDTFVLANHTPKKFDVAV